MVRLRRVTAPVRGPTVPRRRSRWRVAAEVAGVLVVAGLLVATVLWHRQIWSYATHWRGGPSTTWPVEPLPGDPVLRMAALGDVGDGSDDFHRTATHVYDVSRDRRYDVVYLLGDNVYPRGDPDQLEPRVLEPLRAVLDTGAELRAVLGNHDVMLGRGDEQLARLGMPGRWHAVERAGVLLIGLDSEDHDPAQLAWLDDTLSRSEAVWRIVAIHRPPYSAGYQGSDRWVRDTVVPIVQRHGVQLVLSGHDHDYQRSDPIDGTVFVVSGGGSATRRTGTADFTAAAYSVQHFLDLAVYPDRLLLRAIDADGEVFDEVEIGPTGEVVDLSPSIAARPTSEAVAYTTAS